MRRGGGGFKVTKTVTTSKPSGRVTTTTTKTVTSSPGIFSSPSVVVRTPTVTPTVKLSSSGVKVKVKTPVGKVKVKKTYVVRRVTVAPPRRRFCLARALVLTTAAVALTTVSLAEMDRVVIIKGKKGNFRCARDTDAPTCAVHNIRELGHLVEIRITDSMGQTGSFYSDSYCVSCGQYFMLRREDINIPIEYQVQQQTTVVQGMPPGPDPMMGGHSMGPQPVQQVVTVQQPPLPTIRPAWIKDRDAPNCMRCRSEFTVTLRRHHCRNCGKIFCTNCCFKKMKLKHLGYDSKELTCVECVSFLEQYWHNQRNPQKVVVNTPANTNVSVLPNPMQQPMSPQQPYGAYPQQPGANQQYYPPSNGSVVPNPSNQQPITPQHQYDPQYNNNNQMMQQQPYPQQPYDPSGQQKVYVPTQYSAHVPVPQQPVMQPQPTTQFTQIYNSEQPAYDPSRPHQFSAHAPPPSNQTYAPTIVPTHSTPSGPNKNLDELFSSVKTNLSNATHMHSHYRYNEAAEALEKARTDLNTMDTPPSNFVDKVRSFVQDMRYQIDSLDKKIAESMTTRVVDDKVREAKSHGTTAKDMHYHNRYDESLNAVAKARAAIAELSSPPYSTHPSVYTFLPDFINQINEIEAKCGESMLSRKIDEKIREAKSLGNTAKDMHYHNRYDESLSAVAKARECISNLQATYGGFKSVAEFVPDFARELDNIEAACGESLLGRKIDEKIREAKSLGTKAKDMHFHYRFSESLEAVAKARECIVNLQTTYGTFKMVIDFLPDFIKQIDDIERQCSESMMNRTVDEKIREAKSHGNTAKDMIYHNRYQEALTAVTKARETILQLSDMPFINFPAVTSFLPEFIMLINGYEQTCDAALQGRS